MDVRNDSVGGPLGLYLTRATDRYSTVRADESDQTSIGVFGETDVEWSRMVRTTFGLRGDFYHWNVQASNPLNSGTKTSGILSPKVSAAFGPWSGTELYANWGLGFHSNSGLGITLAGGPILWGPGHGLTDIRPGPWRRVRRPDRRGAQAPDHGHGLVSWLRLRTDLRGRLGAARRTVPPPGG